MGAVFEQVGSRGPGGEEDGGLEGRACVRTDGPARGGGPRVDGSGCAVGKGVAGRGRDEGVKVRGDGVVDAAAGEAKEF